MKSKKLLSLLLALMMMLSVVPMYASAADPIQLTFSNITTYPTITGDDFYFGQAIGNQTISGGEVQYNGTVVAGHFELTDSSDYVPTKYGTTGAYANIKFVPDDTSAYVGFEVSHLVQYNTLATTPVVVTAPSVSNTIDSGKRLMTLSLNKPTIKNPYSGEEFEASCGWTTRTTKITASGWHDVTISGGAGYERITAKVYVRLTGDDSEIKLGTVIKELPTVENTPIYGDDWSTVQLSGGKVVDDINGYDVSGKFVIGNTGIIDSAGIKNVDITFVPNDTTYASSASKLQVTVNPAPIKFVDENGAECVPEITVPYGTTFSSGGEIGVALRSKLNVASEVSRYVYVLDDEGNIIDSETVAPVGTKEYKVKATSDNKNYAESELTFKLTVEPTDVKVNILALTDTIQVKKANNNDPTPTGTFAIYVDGQLLKDGVKENHPVEWNPTASKTYEIKAVYAPVANDPVNVEDVTISTERKLERKITYIGSINGGNPSYLCGATVTISANAESFEGWVITDANGNAVDLGVDLTATEISFTMPDYDIIIEAKTAETGDDNTGDDDDSGITLPDLDLDTDGSHKFSFVNIIKNIVEMIKDFIQQIGDFFSNMSLDSLGEVIG